ncbi:cbb3-type cytochrome oxidase assembly protein CcoS [Thermomonas brevis]|jgi:cbb3-type cytochrome oxidase maturation protein
MNILLFLIPISLVMIGAAALLFAWAVKHGQFEDLDTPALDILREDDRPPPPAQDAPADDRDAG